MTAHVKQVMKFAVVGAILLATTGTVTFYAPRSCASDVYEYALYDGNGEVVELAQTRLDQHDGAGQEDDPAILVLGKPEEAPPMQSMVEAVQLATTHHPAFPGDAAEHDSAVINAMLAAQTQQLHFVPLDELPADWLPYTAADVVVASWRQLRQLEKDRPEVLLAIARWTRGGGNLIVYGVVGSEQAAEFDPRQASAAETVRPVEKLFGMTPAGEWGGKLGCDWHRADPRDVSEHVAGVSDQSDHYSYAHGMEVEDESEQEDAVVIRTQLSALRSELPFAWREHGFGTVLVVFEESIPDRQPPFWSWVFNTIGTDKWKWRDRHAITYTAENRHFRNLLIPGVGMAPTVVFQVLITLFVILIGPVLYFVAARTKRLHYLLFIVPAAALAVCVGLFAYALFADGLGIRQRARTFTYLDQRTGEAVTWSRLSYYAGLAPGDGLRFSAETAVYPLPPSIDHTAATRRLTWDDRQRLEDNWLPSRTPIQLVAVKPEQTSLGLAIDADDDSFRVENNLGQPVEMVILRDADGNYFRAASIAAGDAAAAGELDPLQAKTELLELFQENRLKDEIGAVPTTSAYSGRNYYGSYYYGHHGQDIGDADSRLEQAMTEALSGAAPDLPRRSYVAILARNPFAEPGHPRALEEMSFHVVRGTW